MIFKSIFSAAAVILTLYAFIPYIIAIHKAEVRPHMFSWIIWGISTIIVFFAQLSAKGGIGAWPIGVSGCLTLVVAYISFIKRADVQLRPIDSIFFILALSSLPLWFITTDPLTAVLVLTLVDLLGFGPTFRKVIHAPYSESIGFFAIFTLRNILVILALEHYVLATVLFPATIATTTTILIALIFIRRRLLIRARKTIS